MLGVRGKDGSGCGGKWKMNEGLGEKWLQKKMKIDK